MHVEQISNVDAVLFVLGILAFAWAFLRLVPGGEAPPQDSFDTDTIIAYDQEIPKYFLFAALALILGGFHTIVKNLPGFWLWLWEAGYGGHLFRDLSNSHLIIVGGGTVLLTGITWYLLPRFLNRPLFSNSLATASFWLTVSGLFSFYLAWLILGLVEGSMVRHGWDYLAAKDALGNWHRIPTALSSSIMGFGYWSYVLNVFLTVFAARKVPRKPLNYLAKFSAVSAGALFVGTVQGVIQVLPDNADWIRAAGKFGEYVDPISHAHVNLVTGVVVSLAAFLVYFGPRMGGRPIRRRSANLLFWLLVPGSLAFYLAFLLLGLTLGGAAVGGGIEAPTWVPFLGAWRGRILALAGTAMLAGFWAYFLLLWRSLGLRRLREYWRAASPAAFWLISSLALVVGTFQGLLQLAPGTARILTTPEEVPNIHAQLNMIGGVMLALIGIVYLLLPELVGRRPRPRLVRASLLGVGGGIGGYYLATLTTGLLRYYYLRQGMGDVAAAAHLGWAAPLTLLLTAVPMFAGYLAFGTAVWRATDLYRRHWFARLRTMPARLNGNRRPWLRHIPAHYLLAVEAASAFFGFPGLGWLLAGFALPGIPLLLAGPAVAWALLPILLSPYGDGPLVQYGLTSLLTYLIATATVSPAGLWLVLRQGREAESA